MASDQGEPEFNRARAELFEALGHPTRIRILQTLEREKMGFAELKRAVSIESSGHLSFHLGKLEGLLRVDQDGGYSLTDEGREALRVISVTRNEGEGSIRVSTPRLARRNVAIVALVVAILLLSSFAVYQQQQISSLNHSITSQQVGLIVINGTRYSYLDIPLQSLSLPATIQLNGVTFNLTASPLGGSGLFTVMGAASNLTLATVNGTGTSVTFRILPLPNFQMKFSDGQSESYNLVNASYGQSGTVRINFQPTINPWFTRHTNPQAGIRWNSTTDTVELLVSMGA